MDYPNLYSNPSVTNVTCPSCGRKTTANTYWLVSTQDHPEYDNMLKDFRTEEFSCNHCGQRYNMTTSGFVYFNYKIGLICYVVDSDYDHYTAIRDIEVYKPFYGVSNIYLKNLHLIDYRNAGFNIRIVSSHKELREKVLIYKHGLDDKIMELFKYGQKSVLRRSIAVDQMYFNGFYDNKQMSFLLHYNGEWHNKLFDYSFYTDTADFFKRFSKSDSLYFVNEAWVKSRK